MGTNATSNARERQNHPRFHWRPAQLGESLVTKQWWRITALGISLVESTSGQTYVVVLGSEGVKRQIPDVWRPL